MVKSLKNICFFIRLSADLQVCQYFCAGQIYAGFVNLQWIELDCEIGFPYGNNIEFGLLSSASSTCEDSRMETILNLV